MNNAIIIFLIITIIVLIRLLFIEYKISKSQTLKCSMFNTQSVKYKQVALAGHILFDFIYKQKNKLPFGIAVVGFSGVVLSCNEAFKDISKQKNPVGLNFRDFTHKDYLDVDVEQVHKLINYEITHYRMRKAYIDKTNNDEKVYVNLCVICLRDVDEYPSKLIAFINT